MSKPPGRPASIGQDLEKSCNWMALQGSHRLKGSPGLRCMSGQRSISYLLMEVPKSQSQASGATESAGKASASISFNPEIQAGTSPLMNALVCLAILNRSPSYVNKRRQTLKTGPLYPLYICITFSIFNALISWDSVMLKERPLPGLTNSER